MQIWFDAGAAANATVVLDVVSLFPTENVRRAANAGEVNPWPFRQDLLDALQALSPACVCL